MVETKLVPTETIEQPMLSEAQLQELSGSARLYLRQRKIPIANNDIFTGAVAVLGDAVSRGLKEQGRAAVLESEHLTPLIKQGLKIREELCVQAGLDQKMAESLSMPDQLVSQAKQEIRNFALCPRPEACEALISLYQQRVRFVAGFARTGLASLPGEFQNARLERFPNPADQAKLARNMITSFVFRGSLNPLITSEELKDFGWQARKRTYFDETQQESLIEALGISDGDEVLFAKVIFVQTAGLFAGPYFLPQEGDTESINQFYRYFSNFLLLQHPELEAEQIIIHPDRIQAESPSLWDGASSIRGVLVPTPEMLVLAARQEEARSVQARFIRPYWGISGRLNGGVKVWILLQREIDERLDRIGRLGTELKDRELLLANLQVDPSLPLPKRAYDIIYASQVRTRDELGRANQQVKTVQDRIQEMALEYGAATSYRDGLIQSYGNAWPDQLPIPEAVLSQRKESGEANLKSKIVARTARLTLITKLLSLDPLYNPVQAGILINFNRPEAGNWLKEEITRTQTLLHSTDRVEDPGRFLRRIQARLIYGLEDLDIPAPKAVMLQAMKDYSNFWRGVYTGVHNRTQNTKDYWQEEQWPDFIREVLERRISLMEIAQTALADRFILKGQLANRQSIVGSEASFWSADEARSYINVAVASELTSMPASVPVNWLEEAHKMLNLLPLLKSWGDLPITDHPIVPKKFTDLPRADFIAAWRKRCQRVLLAGEFKDAQSRLQTAKEHFEGVCRVTFMVRLMEEIKGLKFRLERVQERDPEARFIERMREINLVLETGVQ